MTHLNGKLILKILGVILIILGVSMVPSFITSIVYAEHDVVLAFLVCMIPLIVAGIYIIRKTKTSKTFLKLREGYLIVTLCWLCASLLGSVPYLISGITSSFIDAFFESVAGFTTTGCTTIDISLFPKGLIMWKAVSHLLGGMGILVFAISILPALGIGGQQIVKAESPGPTLNKAASRISDSSKILYLTYISFGFAEFILLALSPMHTFDAIIHTFGSISTSGLSYHAEGLAYYNSFYIEAIICLFTILSSINFVLYANIIRGRWRELTGNVEVRAFLLLILVASILVSLDLFFRGNYDSFLTAFRNGGFQVIALFTTSGYAIDDFAAWSSFCKTILFTIFFIGGCAASTCGSIKVVRILVLIKLIIRGFLKRIHPNSVVAVKLGGKTVSSETVSSITSFILMYLSVFLISSLILSLQNLDFFTTLSIAASMLSNTGCHLGIMGAESNYSMFAPLLRLFLSLLMIVGRLEIFTIIILLSPRFWNPDR